jgi:methyl-accepting chemotaxis protein
MNNSFINYKKLNKVTLIVGWIAIFLAGAAGYFFKNQISDVLIIWGIGIATFGVPNILYLIRKDTPVVKYMATAAAYIVLFVVLYYQDGAKDNLFVIFWAIAITFVYFDKNLTIFSVIFGCIIVSALFAFYKSIFFPDLVFGEIVTLCVSMIVVGAFFFASTERVEKLIIESLNREKETKELNEKMTILFNNIVSASAILDKNISKLNDDTNKTHKEINQITLSIQATSSALDAQSTNTYDSIQSLNNIENIIKTVEKNSEQMSTVSNVTYQSAENGKEIVNELVRQIHVIKEAVNASADTITDLSSQSKLITNIVSLINDVASQINLLSLNASIEAARAGDQGKGFAVVANEIKNLANQTSKSVNDIAKILEYITQKVENVTSQIQGGNDAVEKGISITDNSYKCFIDISDKVNEIKDKAGQVHQDIDYLSNESYEVFKKIEDVGDLTKKSSSSMEEISASTENQNEALIHINSLIQELINQSGQLKSMVSNASQK